MTSANISIKHYGDEWAEANHREMLARRFHIVSNYTGMSIASSHALEHANDIADDLRAIVGGTYTVRDTHPEWPSFQTTI